MKKNFIIPLGLLLGVALLLLIIYGILNVVWGGQLEMELAALKESGAPMTIEDIKPKPVPDEDNSAVELLKIFALLSDGSFSMKASNVLADRWEDINKKWTSFHRSSFKVENIAHQCQEDSEAYRKALGSDEGKEIIALFEKAASKTKMDFKLDYKAGYNINLPHLTFLRFLDRFIIIKAQLELIDGDRENAWRNIINALKLTLHMKDEPVLISQLVYISLNRLFLNFIDHNLSKYGITNTQAEDIIKVLDKHTIEYSNSMRTSIAGDRISNKSIFTKTIENGLFVGKVPARPMFKRDYAEYLKIMREYELEYNKPYYELKESPVKKQERLKKEIPAYCLFTKMLSPALGSVRLKTAKIVVHTDVTKIRLALEIYKNSHGAYPNKLSSLTPKILQRIPVSDLTGKAFEYEKTSDAYLLKTGLEKK